MGREYKISWKQPAGYEADNVLRKLPSPIAPGYTEIYNFSVKPYGFYMIDHLVDQQTAGHALKLFIDEALSHVDVVSVEEI